MLCLPEDVEGGLCECFARPCKLRDVPGIPEIMAVMAGWTVIRKKVDNMKREFRDEETMVHDCWQRRTRQASDGQAGKVPSNRCHNLPL